MFEHPGKLSILLIISLLSLSFLLVSCSGLSRKESYRHAETEIERPGPAITGHASYYAHKFHGRRTANGEIYDMYGLTAAHKTMPFGTVLEVTNLNNSKSVTVRINDRGPFIKGRDIDLSLGAAEKIDMIADGVVPVRMIILDSHEMPGSGGLYVIQIGSFKNRENAVNLLDLMKKRGFEGYLERYEDFYRVRIGPFNGMDMAEDKQDDFSREAIECFIVRYDK